MVYDTTRKHDSAVSIQGQIMHYFLDIMMEKAYCVDIRTDNAVLSRYKSGECTTVPI